MSRQKTNRERMIKKMRQGKTQGGTIAPGLLPGVNPEDLKSIECKDCGPTHFLPVCDLKLASRFQTQIGQPILVNFQGGFACTKCGKINNFDKSPDGSEVVKDKETDKNLN